MKEANPSMRFLVNLCDPIDRTYSHIVHYLQNEQNTLFGESAEDLMKNFTFFLEKKTTTSVPKMRGAALYGMLEQYAQFSTTLGPFFQAFWRKRFHFIDGEALIRDPQDGLRLNI